MRYDDWDVILFPTGRDSKIPFKEFKVACHVVPDVELAHIHGAAGLPVMTCFVPSLPPGTAFQISLHCWRRPDISQFTRSYSKHTELVKFEARILIDGRQVATTVLDREVNGPHLITNTFEFTRMGEFERLKFPAFRRELLYQDHWSPGDDTGRIKIVISEGFPRDSASAPIERLKNVAAFAFQHAPLEILETNAIAWPNPSMWRCSTLAPAMPVPTYHIEDGPSSHTHSPGRKSVSLRSVKNSGFPPTAGVTSSVFQPQASTNFLDTAGLHMSHLGRNDMFANASSFSDPFTESAYHEWVTSLTGGPPSEPWDGRTIWPTSPRNAKKQSSDTFMSDYVPGRHSDPMHISGPSLEDDPMSLKVPANTPTTGNTDDGQDTQFHMSSMALHPSFASSLTHSLLNQPFPLSVQQNSSFLSGEVKSRKENFTATANLAGHTVNQATGYASTTDARKFSLPIFGVSNLDATVPDTSESPSKEPLHTPTLESFFQPTASENNDFKSNIVTIPSSSTCSTAATPNNNNTELNLSNCGNVHSGLAALAQGNNGNGNNNNNPGGNGGSILAKRPRTFTPASVRAIDEEDEPRRGSPLVRIAGFGVGDIPGNVGQ
ncbi:hypothetical protein N0V88_005985 [Collariella sp. IMI 366227]|nr:hypothetical protein N0V88_005985 [Collariella sp. IMI 366227]